MERCTTSTFRKPRFFSSAITLSPTTTVAKADFRKLIPLLSAATRLPKFTITTFSAPLAPINGGTVFKSWLDVLLPFSHLSPRDRCMFQNPHNLTMLRWGRLFEILDLIVADVAYRHCDPLGCFHKGTQLALVTAAIDNISIDTMLCENELDDCSYLRVDQDIGLRAYLTRVGRSSMEVRAEVWQNQRCVTSGFFSMVLLDKKTFRPTVSPPLEKIPNISDSTFDGPPMSGSFKQPSGETISRIMGSASDRNARRINSAEGGGFLEDQSPIHREPGPSDASHGSRLPSLHSRDSVLMADTRISSALLMQPDHQNIFGKMFGGYIARKAFETSWLCVQCFSRHQPQLRGIDDMFFLHPVEIGDMIDFVATVVLSDIDEIQIKVDAWKISPETGAKQKTNEFHFYYDATQAGSFASPGVTPGSSEDARLHLEAKRRSKMRKRKMMD